MLAEKTLVNIGYNIVIADVVQNTLVDVKKKP